MRRLASTALLVAAIAVPAAAQLKVPRVSQTTSTTQTIGLTDVTVKYNRPGVKGRTIYGGLVPYEKVWRTGANEATQVTFSEDVTIDGQKVPKGSYSLHTIPGRDEWTVIFNGVANQWGSYTYDQTKDVARVKVKPVKAPFTEWLTIDFPAVGTDSGTMMIRWADVAVPVVIETGTTERVRAAAREAIATAKADDWRTSYSAAAFAFENNLNDDAKTWLDASLKANENMVNLWLKARMLAKAGQTADAIRTGELALAKKTERDNADFAAEIRRTVDSWKK